MSETNIESEKTDRLRKIFMDVADDPTVTEAQEETRGVHHDTSAVDETLGDIIREMETEYSFQTSLSTSELVQLVQLFFDGYSDTAIARELGNASRDKAVNRARIHLQLFRETDFNSPFDLDRLRDLLREDVPTADIAKSLSVSKSTVRKYRNVIEAERAATAVDHRYRRRFEATLAASEQDEFLRISLDDGLDDAIDASLGDN
ncbi:response regulator receiver protein [Haladaptatus halobius]|uniref:response regulator receiver protein n=1 Tax=Haladaptatus halobius TaxID=2884875 RepID=UPI001D0A80DD|nr:response regulator receiver protein [Haladaptatus halobius]